MFSFVILLGIIYLGVETMVIPLFEEPKKGKLLKYFFLLC